MGRCYHAVRLVRNGTQAGYRRRTGNPVGERFVASRASITLTPISAAPMRRFAASSSVRLMAAACQDATTGRKLFARSQLRFGFLSHSFHSGRGTVVRWSGHREDCGLPVQASASHECISASFPRSRAPAAPAPSGYPPHSPTGASQTSDATREA